MTIKLIKREQWRARDPKPGAATSIERLGTVIHWEGEGWKWPWDHSTCDQKVRAMQNYHMDSKDWSDIAYNFLACPHGYVFEGRGTNRRSSANGDSTSNKRFFAVQLIWGSKAGVTPVDDLLLAGRDAIDYLRTVGGADRRVLGHRDTNETDCPGDFLYAWVKNNCPRPGAIAKPPVIPEDKMTKEQYETLLRVIDNNTKITVNVFNLLADFSRREWHDDEEMNAKIAELQKNVNEANRELDLLTPDFPEPK